MARIDLDLAHAYKPNPREDSDYALLPLTMSFKDGGAYALLGPSGCGKTTMLNIISGLVAPSQGSVKFDGQDVTHASPQERNIAQVFQFPVIYDTMTVAENLAFPLRNRKVPQQQITKRVGEIAEIPLPELRAVKPWTLLVREWEGTLQRVVVLESGFAWNGVTYESLSKVARAITGTNWNGPRFFGLRDRARAS